jgi:hypothetical protein
VSPAACGRPDCPVPVPSPDVVRRVRTIAWPAGTPLRRGRLRRHPDPTGLVPGRGDTRFAPLPGIAHVLVATSTFAALLESAFHDAHGPHPRIRAVQIARWSEAAVTLHHAVRLIDLRDPELDRLGIARDRLVATDAAHYPCTRSWAAALCGRTVGGHGTHGLVWHSRQAELRARALEGRPALRELVDGLSAEVAVLWSPPAPTSLLHATGEGIGPLDGPEGEAYVSDLSALLGITVM